jgi:hypothetical protein
LNVFLDCIRYLGTSAAVAVFAHNCKQPEKQYSGKDAEERN